MKPQTIGRALGIGVRVAGRVAGQRLAGASPPAAPRAVQAIAGSALAVAQARRGASQGIGAFLRPFRRAGGIVWLQVTGVFFLLPVIVFGPMIWATRASWLHGPDHRRFVASVILVVIFLYLGITSFWRARRRSAAH